MAEEQKVEPTLEAGATPAPDAAPEAATKEEDPPPKSKKKLFIILGVLIVLIGGGVGLYVYEKSGCREKSC